MRINMDKTKIMPSNFPKKHDFIPDFKIQDNKTLDFVYETKLVGINVSNNFSWKQNTKFI